MVKIETRINDKGEEEIVISDFSSFEELVEKVNEIRKEEETYHKEPKKILVDQYVTSNKEHIYNEILLSNIIFLQGVNLTNIEFHSNIDFYNIEFKSPVSFRESKFLGDDTTFNNIIFSDWANFIKTSFQKEISFSDILFKKKANFYNTSFINITSMTFSPVFNDEVIFDKAIFDKKNINFNGSIFNNKASFCNCPNLSNVSFINTIFNNRVDFYQTNFTTSHQFYLTSFMDRVNFNNMTFEQEIQFLDCKLGVNSFINFQGATFNNGIDISKSNFSFGKVSFWNISVKDKGLLGRALSSEYYKNDFGKEEVLPSVPTKLRESMRFIKNSFYSEGNRIEGSQFEKKELEIYREEIKGIPKQKIKKEKEETTNNLFLIWEWIKIFFSIYKDFSIIIYSYIKSFREKYGKIYIVFMLLTIIIPALLFITYENHLWFWLFAFIFIITINLEIKRRDINKAIKENNYIPLVLLYSLNTILLILIYGIVPNEYNILETIKTKITNISALDEYNPPIVFGIVVIIALFLTIIFYENDRILLFFNKNSNDFGTNWMVGVNFTTLVGLITSSFILIPLWFNDCIYFNINADGLGDFLHNFVEIINVTKWTHLEFFGRKPTSWQYVWLFIGRIFIGYGVYQTIQAFRKYGKS